MAYTLQDWQSGIKPPKGWDVADACKDGWTKDDIMSFMRAAVAPWEPPSDRVPAPVPAPVVPQKTVTQAKTMVQADPAPATVTHIHTRKTVKADDSWQINLVFNEEGKTKPGVTKNWALYLENHPDMVDVFAWDAFKMRVMLMRCPPWESEGEFKPRVLQDRDYSEAVMWLETHHMTPKASNIAAVIQTVAERSSFDNLRDYLEGLAWDGVPRVSQFAAKYLGCRGDNYSPIVSERWLVSSVARGLEPGCKVDTMPILEGPQGLNKSTALSALYGAEFFTDELSDLGSKDASMELQGVWCIEIAEMHRFSASETNQVKKFLSRQVDRFRPPYGRSVIDAPRRAIMAGTINPEGNAYLRDPTGARRFWPLTCGKIDIAAIKRDRDQLWAEAVHMYKSGVKWWVQQDETQIVEAEQEKRTDVDVWMDEIATFVRLLTTISQSEIFEKLNIPKKDLDYRHSQRIGRIMKRLGWSSRRDRRGGQDRVIFDAPEKPAPENKDRMEW